MRKATILLVIIAAMMTIPAAVASADPGKDAESTPASCVGIESSSISPSGTSEEFAGGRPELNDTLRQAFPDVPLGHLVRDFAQGHAGSHDKCDAGPE